MSLKKVFFILVVSFLSGCSAIYGKNSFTYKHQTEYLQAEEVPPLQLPPGLNSGAITDHYYIPPLAIPKPTEPVGTYPPRVS